MTTDIVILAAGQGTRMKSELPKVLHRLGGIPLLQHVVNAARAITGAKLTIVAGHGMDKVASAINGPDIVYVKQVAQLGTGHAVQQALSCLHDEGTTLVLYADVPLIRPATLARLLAAATEKTVGLLTVNMEDPTGYGRIVRGSDDQVEAIVEQKDASEAQRKIKEVNTGLMAIKTEKLREWLPKLGNDNAQGEYYLTDLIAIARDHGMTIETRQPESMDEVLGVNDRVQLATLERRFQHAQAEALLRQGASLADPARFDCRGNVIVGRDVFIDVNCIFEGRVELGNNVSIGPYSQLKDCRIADNVEIKSHSVLEGADIGEGAVIGPFARIRPQTELAANTKVGNFVELKKAKIGEGSKINHLSYVGDAKIGRDVNIGAGTITCNYDGVNKHLTEIEDNAFIGSNTALIAPVKIGKNATIGAGSAIGKNVGDDELALTRSKQVVVKDWPRPDKKDGEKIQGS